MAGLRSNVPELLSRLGWDARTFVGHCYSKGISLDTAYRLTRGEVNVTTQTLAVVAEVLGVKSISDIIDIDDKAGEQ